MKKFSLFILLLAGLFADWKITQYIGSGSYGPVIKTWVTKDNLSFIGFAGDIVVFKFLDSKTNKKVMVSIPFTIEEL